MKNLKIFNENLATAFVLSYTKTPDVIKRMSCNIDDDRLMIKINREKQGLVHCINASLIEIKPEPGKKHHMHCTEVWVGYDSEGYHWSDAMGGRLVDCTGMTVDQAIDHIVTEVKEMIKNG